MHNGARMKVVGAINNYESNGIVYECNNWVIYDMLLMEELKPNNLNSQSKSLWVCNTCLLMSPTA